MELKHAIKQEILKISGFAESSLMRQNLLFIRKIKINFTKPFLIQIYYLCDLTVVETFEIGSCLQHGFFILLY